jgi:hypothetical protein
VRLPTRQPAEVYILTAKPYACKREEGGVLHNEFCVW